MPLSRIEEQDVLEAARGHASPGEAPRGAAEVPVAGDLWDGANKVDDDDDFADLPDGGEAEEAAAEGVDGVV
jgi:hypothetical protein